MRLRDLDDWGLSTTRRLLRRTPVRPFTNPGGVSRALSTRTPRGPSTDGRPDDRPVHMLLSSELVERDSA
jgi:hypothetical protein